MRFGFVVTGQMPKMVSEFDNAKQIVMIEAA